MSAEKKYTPEARARASALGSLAMREHSCFELQTKLINKGHDSKTVELLIIDLLENNLISDVRFAESFWRSRSNKGYGPTRIRKELTMKGVSADVSKQTEDVSNIDFFAIVETVYAKKYKGIQWHEYKEKAKRQSFLYRRGFDIELINSVIE